MTSGLSQCMLVLFLWILFLHQKAPPLTGKTQIEWGGQDQIFLSRLHKKTPGKILVLITVVLQHKHLLTTNPWSEGVGWDGSCFHIWHRKHCGSTGRPVCHLWHAGPQFLIIQRIMYYFKFNSALENALNVSRLTEAALNHAQIFTEGQVWPLEVIHTQ